MADNADFEYSGSELELFADAQNWRAYWMSRVAPYVRGRVLEVGAGIGTITKLLASSSQEWTAVEPDQRLSSRISEWAKSTKTSNVTVVTGSIGDVASDEAFDTILYVDVLEHIEHDAEEARAAFSLLAPGGCIVILGPAHQWLFTPFDESIGHFRRYNAAMLRALRPSGAVEVACEYLDSAGTLASAGNRLLLRSASPTRAQIRMWDARLVPVSRVLDPVLGHRLGKSILVVWRKDGAVGS